MHFSLFWDTSDLLSLLCFPSPPPGCSYIPLHANISSRLHLKIFQGHYVNLISIIPPSPEVDQCVAPAEGFSAILKASDPHMSKDLSIGQFLATFSVYRDMICSVYPNRQSEFVAYLALIADLHLKYSRSTFFQYHKAFAAKASATLAQSGLTLDWSILDTEILIMLTQMASCHLRGSVGHQNSVLSSHLAIPNLVLKTLITTRWRW